MERHWLVLFLLVAIRLALAETDVSTDIPVSTETSESEAPKITETVDVSPSSESVSPSSVGDDRPSIYLFRAPSSIKSAQKIKGPETSSEYALPWHLAHSTQQVTTSTSTEPPSSESLNWFQRRQQEQQRIQQQQKEQIQVQQEQQRIQQQQKEQVQIQQEQQRVHPSQKEQVQIQQSQQEQQRIQVQQQQKEQQRIQVQQQQKEQQRIQEQQRVQVQQQEQQRVQVQQQEQQKVHVQQQQEEKIPQYQPQQEQQRIQIQQQQQEKIPQYQPQQDQQKVQVQQQQEQQKVQVQQQQEQQRVQIQEPQVQEKYQPQTQTRFQFQQQQHRVQQQQQHRIQQQQRVQQQLRQPFEEGFSNIKQFKSSSIKTAPAAQQVEQTEKITETNNEVSPKGKVPFQSQPSEEDRLQKADQALDQYFNDVLANLSVKMKTGMDEPLGEILDPVRLDDMQLQPLVAGEVFDVRMKKISVGGLSDFRVTQLESQLSESRIKVGIHYPKISANCLFGANGTLYEIFKVTGRGNATIIFNEVHARTVLYLTKDNGVLQVTSADQPYVDFKSAEILFKDEDAADDVEPVKAESVATQLGPLYFWVLTANAVDKIDYPLAEYFNKALKEFPLSDFLDGHVFRQRHLRIHVPSHPIPYAYVASDLA